MGYSTGRGGAGNIQSDANITSYDNRITPTESAKGITPQKSHSQSSVPQQSPRDQQSPQDNSGDKKYYYATGRGGAGNIHSSRDIPSPKLVPQGSATPQLHQNIVSTGRGGYGNMLKNDDPDLTRKVQDVDGPSNKENELCAVASNKSFSIGRGGFGNVVSNGSKHSQISEENEEPVNLMAISSHGDKKKPQKKGFFDKIKDYFS